MERVLLKFRSTVNRASGSATLLLLLAACSSNGAGNAGSSASGGSNGQSAGAGSNSAGRSAGGGGPVAAGSGGANPGGGSNDGGAPAAGGSGNSSGGASALGGASSAGASSAGAAAGGTSAAGGASAGCTPDNGFAFTFACWKMPNPASTGLPNPSDYTDQSDGTVRDNVTGLVWQKAVDATTQKLTWDAAKSYCAALPLAGRTWRLPTRIELLSIVDFTRVGPAINAQAFPSVPGGAYHWTSSPWVVSQIASKP